MRRPLGALAAACAPAAVCAPIACSGGEPAGRTGDIANGGPSAPACGAQLDCPSPAPTWTQVQPIVQTFCDGCHGAGGIEQGAASLITYQQAESVTAYGEVLRCVMPPPDAGQPTPAQRSTLLEWYACATPYDD